MKSLTGVIAGVVGGLTVVVGSIAGFGLVKAFSPTQVSAPVVLPTQASVVPMVASSPAVVSVASVKPVATVATVATAQVPFEALSYCDQLDALAKGGKSISNFILDSADSNGYIFAARSSCTWHQSQADVAYNALHPPVIEVPTTIVNRTVTVTANSDADLCLISDPCHPHHGQWLRNQQEARDAELAETVRIVPDGTIDPGFGGKWNDCDGVKEPGESPSGHRC